MWKFGRTQKRCEKSCLLGLVPTAFLVLLDFHLCFYLTNKEARAVYHTVTKHDRHLRTQGKCRKHALQVSVFFMSQVFSNVQSNLSQCDTRLRLLHLLYDIDFTHAKQYTSNCFFYVLHSDKTRVFFFFFCVLSIL